MSDEPQASVPSPLSYDETALLRRCYRVGKITDEEIVFPVAVVASAKAAWLTMFWFACLAVFLICRWGDIPKEAPSLVWLLLGVFPTYGLIWLAAHRPSHVILKRGTRTMIVDLSDGRWTIQLPQGVPPANWDFPTASIPVRVGADEVERVNAGEVLERFVGLSPSDPMDTTSALGLLEECGADVVGYDDDNVSIANFGSGRSIAILVGLILLCGPMLYSVIVPFVELASRSDVSAPPLSLSIILTAGGSLGGVLIALDSRPSSVATFRRGKRQVHLLRRGRDHVYEIHESAVSVISDGDVGELVSVPEVFSCSPINGTANLLAGFLRRHLAPLKKKPTTRDT